MAGAGFWGLFFFCPFVFLKGVNSINLTSKNGIIMDIGEGLHRSNVY